MPDFSKKFVPKHDHSKLTEPEPFKLRSDERGSMHELQFREKIDEEVIICVCVYACMYVCSCNERGSMHELQFREKIDEEVIICVCMCVCAVTRMC